MTHFQLTKSLGKFGSIVRIDLLCFGLGAQEALKSHIGIFDVFGVDTETLTPMGRSCMMMARHSSALDWSSSLKMLWSDKVGIGFRLWETVRFPSLLPLRGTSLPLRFTVLANRTIGVLWKMNEDVMLDARPPYIIYLICFFEHFVDDLFHFAGFHSVF